MINAASHISDAERAQFTSFQLRKAAVDSYTGGSYFTGWIGRIGAMIALSESDAMENPNLTQEQKNKLLLESLEKGARVTSWIGGVVGFVVSPVKIIQVLATRELLFSAAQLKQVSDGLNALAPALQLHDQATPGTAMSQPVEQFQSRVTALVSNYGETRFNSSEGSRELIEGLQEEPKLFVKAGWIFHYLNEPGQALSCINAEQYPKNQGKRLFNVIMRVFTQG